MVRRRLLYDLAAGILTDAELREKAREVRNMTSGSEEPGLAQAGTRLLAGMTTGTTEDLLKAAGDFDRECDQAGLWPNPRKDLPPGRQPGRRPHAALGRRPHQPTRLTPPLRPGGNRLRPPIVRSIPGQPRQLGRLVGYGLLITSVSSSAAARRGRSGSPTAPRAGRDRGGRAGCPAGPDGPPGTDADQHREQVLDLAERTREGPAE